MDPGSSRLAVIVAGFLAGGNGVGTTAAGARLRGSRGSQKALSKNPVKSPQSPTKYRLTPRDKRIVAGIKRHSKPPGGAVDGALFLRFAQAPCLWSY